MGLLVEVVAMVLMAYFQSPKPLVLVLRLPAGGRMAPRTLRVPMSRGGPRGHPRRHPPCMLGKRHDDAVWAESSAREAGRGWVVMQRF